MKRKPLPTVAKVGITKALYEGILEAYDDVLREIDDMKGAFNNTDKEMIILNSLEKTIILQSSKEKENMDKAMSKFNIRTKRSLFNRLFNNKKA